MQRLRPTEDVFVSRVQNNIPGSADFSLRPEMYQPVNNDSSPDPLFYAGRYGILNSGVDPSHGLGLVYGFTKNWFGLK